MGEKDITEKILEDYNDVFADIINGLLFDGVQEIKPEALENTNVHAQYKAEDERFTNWSVILQNTGKRKR